jgi:hypothetical protein
MVVRAMGQYGRKRPYKLLLSYIESCAVVMEHQHGRTLHGLGSLIRDEKICSHTFPGPTFTFDCEFHIPAFIPIPVLDRQYGHFRIGRLPDLRDMIRP